MARVVESVATEFGDALFVEKVITKQLQGAMRYRDISKSLGRPAPVPSIFIEDDLVFEQTPSQGDLRDFLNRLLGRSG